MKKGVVLAIAISGVVTVACFGVLLFLTFATDICVGSEEGGCHSVVDHSTVAWQLARAGAFVGMGGLSVALLALLLGKDKDKA